MSKHFTQDARNKPGGLAALDNDFNLNTPIKIPDKMHYHAFDADQASGETNSGMGIASIFKTAVPSNYYQTILGIFDSVQGWTPFVMMGRQLAGTRPTYILFHAYNYGFKRDPSDDIVFNDYDTGEAWGYVHRYGVNDYRFFVKQGGAWVMK